MRAYLLTIGLLLAAGPVAAQSTTIRATDFSTKVSTDVGDSVNHALKVNLVASTLAKQEDAAHSPGDLGMMALCVRQSVSVDMSSNAFNTDYEPCQVDATGRMWVNPFPATPSATQYIPYRATDGTAFLVAGSDYIHNTLLVPGTTAGPASIYRASAAAPTDVTGDNYAVLPWATRAGAAVVQLSAGGVLLGGSATAPVAVRSTDGTNYLTSSVDYQQNVALTVSTTAGPLGMGRASAVEPTAVGADDRSVMGWMLPTGAMVNAIGASTYAGIAGSECIILTTASNNATNCKNGPGNFYGIDVYNTTTTTYYLRLYNTSAAPTCSSSTGFIRSIPIPPAASAGQVGGIVRVFPIPVAYSTGISYCLTGGAGNTDNTNAAVGIFGALIKK